MSHRHDTGLHALRFVGASVRDTLDTLANGTARPILLWSLRPLCAARSKGRARRAKIAQGGRRRIYQRCALGLEYPEIGGKGKVSNRAVFLMHVKRARRHEPAERLLLSS